MSELSTFIRNCEPLAIKEPWNIVTINQSSINLCAALQPNTIVLKQIIHLAIPSPTMVTQVDESVRLEATERREDTIHTELATALGFAQYLQEQIIGIRNSRLTYPYHYPGDAEAELARLEELLKATEEHIKSLRPKLANVAKSLQRAKRELDMSRVPGSVKVPQSALFGGERKLYWKG